CGRRLVGAHARPAALRGGGRRPAESDAVALAARGRPPLSRPHLPRGAPRADDTSYRAVTFDEVSDAYAHQIRALRDGGVDLLLVETVFDTLNAKAAIVAAHAEAPELPLWLSFTAIDRS